MLADSHLHILLALASGDAHGYAIMRATDQFTGGAVALKPGVLYTALGRLADDGLIEELDDRPARELDDQRRRYYRLTPAGRAALGAEVSRLNRLVAHARGIEPGWAAS